MIDHDCYDKIRRITDAKEISIAEWVRAALDEKLGSEWSHYENDNNPQDALKI